MTEETTPDISMAPIESWPVDKVLPYEENNKIHSPSQVARLAKSINSQGLNDPITVDSDGYIISGHGRLQAVKSLGWTHVAVRHLHMLTKPQADKLRIAANKTSSNEYDFDAMQRELNRLGGLGVDIDDIGLDDKELEMMVGDIGDLNIDMVSSDISADVDAFERKTEEEAEEILSEGVTLAKAFGVKKIPLSKRRTATIFMGEIEKSTGLTGAEALVKFMEDYIDG